MKNRRGGKRRREDFAVFVRSCDDEPLEMFVSGSHMLSSRLRAALSSRTRFFALLSTLAVIVFLAAAAWQWPEITRSAPTARLIADLDFTHGITDAQTEGAWVPTVDGLALAPGSRASLTIRFQPAGAGYPAAILWVYSPDPVVVRISCSPFGGRFVELPGRTFVGEYADLSPCGNDGFAFRIEAESPSTAPGVALIVDKIQYTALDGRPLNLPRFPLFLVALLTFAAAGIAAYERALAWPVALVIASSSVLPMFLDSGLSGVLLAGAVVPLGLLAAAGAVRRSPVLLEASLLFVLLCAGAYLRWKQLAQSFLSPLFPDAEIAAAIAARMRHPWDTSVREPLWIWVIRINEWLGLDPSLRTRLFSFGASLLLLVAAYVLARRYLSSVPTGLLTLALLTVHPYLVASSSTGLRTELQAAVLVATAFFALVPMAERRRVIGYSITAVVGVLTYLGALLPAVAMLGWAWWKHRMHLRSVAIILTLIMLFLAPVMAHNWIEFRDPLYSTNTFAAVWYRNYEYLQVKQTSCEGCPTHEEWLMGQPGARIDMREYVFGMHAPREVAARIASGYADTFVRHSSLWQTIAGHSHKVFFVTYWLGIVLLAYRRERDLLLAPLLALNLLAFIIPIGVDPRLLMFAAPFVAIAVAFGIVRPLSSAANAIRAKERHRATRDASGRKRTAAR
jgi:hypothetical protein